MPTPARQLIVEAIFEKLKTVTKANGYRTDIGLHVFRWKVNPWGEHDASGRTFLDGCNLMDKACTVEGMVSGSHDWKLDIEIEVYGDGEGSDSFLRSAEADLISMIGVDSTFGVGSLRARTRTLGFASEMNMKQNERIEASMKVSFQVEFRTPLWSPYPFPSDT